LRLAPLCEGVDECDDCADECEDCRCTPGALGVALAVGFGVVGVIGGISDSGAMSRARAPPPAFKSS